MKKMLTLGLALLCLLGGCHREKPADTVADVMTDTAVAYGITAENYPRIDGSTSTLEMVQSIWYTMYKTDADYDAYGYPEQASRTVPSYRKLINGEVDLILVPYASAAVLQEAKDAGVELEFHKIAAEALIFITPKDNTTEDITREQVRSIYLDYAIKNWSELGGPDRELVPLCRNIDSGSQSQMDNLVLDNQPMHPDIADNFVEMNMEGMLEQTAWYHTGGTNASPTDSYALGYTLYSYLQTTNNITGIGEHLRILSYEGLAPTKETIADGSYPLTDGYYAVVRRDLPKDHTARAVLRWYQSAEGRQAVSDDGFIPVR